MHNSLNFSFNIQELSTAFLVPKQKNIVNSFDLIGDLYGLKRLPGESNSQYKDRLFDLSVHPGGPTYKGIIYNLSRELGFPIKKTIEISLVSDTYGNDIADKPKVDILSNRIILYKTYSSSPVIDKEIRFYKPNDPGYTLENLVFEINSSECFRASLFSNIRPNEKSTTLIRNKSSFLILEDIIKPGRFTKLTFDKIMKDSISFSSSDIKREVVTLTKSGDYIINNTLGELYFYDDIQEYSTCSYSICQFPFVVESSEIELFSFQDENFMDELFDINQVSLNSTRGLPNREGSFLLHKLYKESNVFWG